MDDIAVVGIGLRFPGEATSPEELWNALERGESQWSEIPSGRFNIGGYYHPIGNRQGSISFRGAHFLKEDFTTFDAPFFSVAADDAKAIDPQQRFLLEVSYEALENAGIRKEDIDGSDAAVYVGSFVKDYEQVCLRDPDYQPQYAATGNGIAIMANRISHFFNLHGPSMTIDTGCSGSLVSVHLAAQSLRTGETSLAIVAGAGMILTPATMMPMAALNFLSPDGKCFTFDSRANGYGRGEGIGVVILKRLSDALRDNDTIRAVIRGTRINQDGHTPGITLPSKEAQVANISSLYHSVGLSFDQTAYVECHGTGTQAGDWRELKAVSETLGSVRSEENPIIVGSVKPNIGHLEGAAGVAGFIKAVLTLEHGKIPPNINYEHGNPNIDFKEWKVKVPCQLLDWPLPGLRRISVNCFGFGGTNAHAILDEAGSYLQSRRLEGNHSSVEAKLFPGAETNVLRSTHDEPLLFCFSANDKSGIRRMFDAHVEYLVKNNEDQNISQFLCDYSYTLNCRRSALEWRCAIVSNAREDLATKLQLGDENTFVRATQGRQPTVGFVFCGQGAQFAQMGKDLLSFDIFRESLGRASTFMHEALKSPFILLDEILKSSQDSRISAAEISQPATTALQVAVVELLCSFGVSPSMVVGHSSGEIAAAFASGRISREAAWEIAYYRGQVTTLLTKKCPSLKGAMAVIGMGLDEAAAFLASTTQSIQIACINSPRSVTISGTKTAVASIVNELIEKGVFCRKLPVQIAYHSSHMQNVAAEYLDALNHVSPKSSPNTVTMFSSVTGGPLQDHELNNHYWVTNMVRPVRFQEALESMMDTQYGSTPDIIIELSPAAALKTPILDCLSAMRSVPVPIYHSVLQHRDHGAASLLAVAGDLWARGFAVNMSSTVRKGLDQTANTCLNDLPLYQWNHSKSYWHESHLGHATRFREFPRQDLIGAPTVDSIPFQPRWRGFLRVSENPWLQDHQVQKTIVYPAAGMVTMALQGISQLVKDTSNVLGYEISNMRIEKAMIIPNTVHGLEMSLDFKNIATQIPSQKEPGSFEFTIYSKQLDAPWEQHATGSVETRLKNGDGHEMFAQHQARLALLKKSCTEQLLPRQLYELLDVVGMNYGNTFRNITKICKSDDSCLFGVRVANTKSKMPGRFEYPHLIHPATLDSMFQGLFSINHEPMVPTFIGSLFVSVGVSSDASHEFDGYATATRMGVRDAKANIAMTQGTWQTPTVIVEDLHLTGIGISSSEPEVFLPNHKGLCTEIVWEEDVDLKNTTELRRFLRLLAHKYCGLSILQVGGTADTMEDLLHVVAPISQSQGHTPWLSRYSVAKGTPDFPALDTLGWLHDSQLNEFVEMRAIDGKDPMPEYHLILLFDTSATLSSSMIKHLRPGCFLLEQGSGQDDCSVAYNLGESTIQFKVHSPPNIENTFACDGVVLLTQDKPPVATHILHEKLRHQFSARSQYDVECVSIVNAKGKVASLANRVIISALDVDADSIFDWDESDFSFFHSLQNLVAGMIWLTRGAQMNVCHPKKASITGLSRTLRSEDPRKVIVTFDLGPETFLQNDHIAQSIFDIFNTTFKVNHVSLPMEVEYAEAKGKLFVPRLVPVESLNRVVEKRKFSESESTPFHTSKKRIKIDAVESNLANGSILFSEAMDTPLNQDEVEVIFESAPVGGDDLYTITKGSTGSDFGMEVHGKVSRVGSHVTTPQLGIQVSALVPSGTIQNRYNVPAKLTKPWDASILPLNCVASALHCLHEIARVRRGKVALIHAGASAHGLAAISIAKAYGSRIIATVMGENSVRQRLAIRNAGVGDEYILDGQSDNFVKGVKQLTDGRGADIVYNPTQEHIEANFKCVKKGGLVIQFASKSPNPPSVRLSNSSASFVVHDLANMIDNDVDYVAELLEEARVLSRAQPQLFAITTDLVQTFDLSRMNEAFGFVQNSPYLGIVSIEGNSENSPVVNVTAATQIRRLDEALYSNRTYVLAGGLGGLGKSICEHLITHGARHFAFLSRSGASNDANRRLIDRLQEQGVKARVFKVDICDRNALTSVYEAISSEMPYIHGVFQCAAVIRDAVFDNMTFEDWTAATRSKTVGSDNLVDVFGSAGNEQFFIFLASSTGVIGSRGQSNYAAGNAFEDALARALRGRGRHAVSIDLGPVLGAGMLVQDEETLDILKASGFYGIRHEDFLTMVTHAITMEVQPGVLMPPQVTMGVGTGGLMRQNQPADPYWSRTAMYGYLNLVDMPPPDLESIGGDVKTDMKSLLASCNSMEAAVEVICLGLSQLLAKAMSMLPEEIDTSKPPNVYGVDSLVAVGVRNWVLSSCGVEVSVFDVLSNKTVAELAEHIVQKGHLGRSM